MIRTRIARGDHITPCHALPPPSPADISIRYGLLRRLGAQAAK